MYFGVIYEDKLGDLVTGAGDPDFNDVKVRDSVLWCRAIG